MVKQNKGFSIIELVLVLAIAGLIFLMVFIALPALRRSQQDMGRKNDSSTVVSAIGTYRSNNRTGGTMTSANVQGYITSLNQYAKTDVVVAAKGTRTTAEPKEDEILVYTAAKCGSTPGLAEAHPMVTASSRQAAVFVRLENNGGSDGWQIFCQDA